MYSNLILLSLFLKKLKDYLTIKQLANSQLKNVLIYANTL